MLFVVSPLLLFSTESEFDIKSRLYEFHPAHVNSQVLCMSISVSQVAVTNAKQSPNLLSLLQSKTSELANRMVSQSCGATQESRVVK